MDDMTTFYLLARARQQLKLDHAHHLHASNHTHSSVPNDSTHSRLRSASAGSGLGDELPHPSKRVGVQVPSPLRHRHPYTHSPAPLWSLIAPTFFDLFPSFDQVTSVTSGGQAHACGVEVGDWVFEVGDSIVGHNTDLLPGEQVGGSTRTHSHARVATGSQLVSISPPPLAFAGAALPRIQVEWADSHILQVQSRHSGPTGGRVLPIIGPLASHSSSHL